MSSALLYLAVREWSSANVQVWLQQVNQSLHSLYSANFSNHDITGDIMWDCVLGAALCVVNICLFGVHLPSHPLFCKLGVNEQGPLYCD